MQLVITNDGIEVTDALRQYIQHKFERLKRLTNQTTKIHVTLSLEHLSQIAKALVHGHGAEFYARAEAEDLYTAIDNLIDKIELQINKHKQKEKEKRRDHSENYSVDENNEDENTE